MRILLVLFILAESSHIKLHRPSVPLAYKAKLAIMHLATPEILTELRLMLEDFGGTEQSEARLWGLLHTAAVSNLGQDPLMFTRLIIEGVVYAAEERDISGDVILEVNLVSPRVLFQGWESIR